MKRLCYHELGEATAAKQGNRWVDSREVPTRRDAQSRVIHGRLLSAGWLKVGLFREPTPLELELERKYGITDGDAVIACRRHVRLEVARRSHVRIIEAKVAFDAEFRRCKVCDKLRERERFNGRECHVCEAERKKAERQRKKEQVRLQATLPAISADDLDELMGMAA